MNDNLKMGFGIAIFFIVIWGIIGVISGKGFFTPTFEVIDSVGNSVAELITSIIKIAVVGGIIWFIYSMFNKKS